MREINTAEFLSAIFTDKYEPIHLRTFGAKGSKGIVPKNLITTCDSCLDYGWDDELLNENKTKGIYFVVNSGGNKDADITKFNAFFVENDKLTIQEQHKALDNALIQPSIRVETNKSVHAYWLSDGNCNEEDWRDIQARLIAYFDGDKVIKNPSRCMRLPNFNHISIDENGEVVEKLVEITECNPYHRHSVEEMKQAFPLPQPVVCDERDNRDDNNTNLNVNRDNCDNVTSKNTTQTYETWNELNLALGIKIMEQGKRASHGNYQMKCPVHNGNSETSLFYNPETRASYCSSGKCSHSEILEAFGLPTKPSKNEPEEKQNQAALLVALANEADLFTSQNDEPFASILVNNHWENWAIDSKIFRDWLGRKYYQTHNKVASEIAVKEALSTLSGKAKFDGEQKQVHLRRAEFEGNVYLDLVNDAWQVVKITSEGWEITSDCPVKFRRTRGMKALPLPTKNGNLDDLDKFLNIHGDDLKLVKVWLASTLIANIQYPVLVFSSQQNCGKSSSANVLCEMGDPNIGNLVTKPRSLEDLFISVSNRTIIAFDNISYINDELSDAFCQIATGGTFKKRKHYSDDDEVIFKAMNPVILTGIGDIATKGDLLSRCIILRLPTLSQRTSDSDFWKEFNKLQPSILGALLDAVSEGLKNYQFVEVNNCKARMLDFVKFGVALEKHLGLDEGEFIEICNKNYENANNIAIENNPVAMLIYQLMQKQDMWFGSASELLGELYALANDMTKRNPSFPKSSQGLSNQLDRIAPSLKLEGIEIEKGDHLRESGTGKRRIKINKLCNYSSHLSQTSQNNYEQNQPILKF